MKNRGSIEHMSEQLERRRFFVMTLLQESRWRVARYMFSRSWPLEIGMGPSKPRSPPGPAHEMLLDPPNNLPISRDFYTAMS